MQIFVKSLNHTVTVDVPHDATVADLKACVENHEFIPATLQRLVLTSGIQLNAGMLRELGVEEASTVTLMLNVNGGMRAKWRKKRMRRLRRKRRKMRQRAR